MIFKTTPDGDDFARLSSFCWSLPGEVLLFGKTARAEDLIACPTSRTPHLFHAICSCFTFLFLFLMPGSFRFTCVLLSAAGLVLSERFIAHSVNSQIVCTPSHLYFLSNFERLSPAALLFLDCVHPTLAAA